jgi:hypothetical protein
MDWLNRDVAVAAHTEDHAQRFCQWSQAKKQDKRGAQSPKERHASILGDDSETLL